MIFIVAFTNAGTALAAKLAEAYGHGATAFAPEKYAKQNKVSPINGLKEWCGGIWQEAEGVVFVGAAGIAVRTIAPYVQSKTTDPAVVVVDEKGKFVVSLLSGHIGGANELAYRIAELTEGTAVITTATDVNGKFAVDVFAKDNGLYITSMAKAKEISAAILRGESVGFITNLAHDKLPEYLMESEREINIEIGFSARYVNSLLLVPKNMYLGIGCKRGTKPEIIERGVNEFLRRCNIPVEAVAGVGSIDLKSDEQGLLEYADKNGFTISFFTAGELSLANGEFSESEFVRRTTGVGCVCERAAVLASDGGCLTAGKCVFEGVTVAVAEKNIQLKIRKETD